MAALALITSAGGGLAVAVTKLWAWVSKRIDDCEADRIVLHTKIDDMHGEIQTFSRTIGKMEGELKSIANRNNKIDERKKP